MAGDPPARPEVVLDSHDLRIKPVELLNHAGNATLTDFFLDAPDPIFGQAVHVAVSGRYADAAHSLSHGSHGGRVAVAGARANGRH